MTKFKVGDKVRVINVEGIMYGSDFFDEGDISTVQVVEEEPFLGIFSVGGVCVTVTKNANHPRITSEGEDNNALYFMVSELKHLVKIEEAE